MRNFIVRLVCITAGIVLASPASALDRVELKTGAVFMGKLLRKTSEEVSIQIGNGGILTFKAAHVLRVRSEDNEADEADAQAKDGHAGDNDARRELKKEAQAQTDAGKPGKVLVPSPGAISTRAPVQFTGASAPAEPETALVTDEAHGIAVQPPKGFVPWPQGKAATVILAYTDPFTHSTFTLTSFTSPEAIEDIKKKTVQAYSEVFSVFTVLRNEKLKKADKLAIPETWLVEMESRYGNLVTRQIQLFTKKDENVFLLTYTAAEDSYSKAKESFERSIDTFHFLEAAPPAR